MRNLATAVFLAFIFCGLSAIGKDFANGSDQRMSGKGNNRSFRDTLWEEKVKDWKKRHGAIPQRLPRATDAFKLHKQSSSKHYRFSHRSFRSSHSHRTRHGRTHVRRRSRR